MSTRRMFFYLLFVFGAYALVARTDYEEAMRMANAYMQPQTQAHGDAARAGQLYTPPVCP